MSARAKNIVIINGSPRKEGNSAYLATLIDDELRRKTKADYLEVPAQEEGTGEAGSDALIKVDIFSPASHHIKPCIGCERCCKTGECVLRDDMSLLVSALDSADMLIWISPLYFGGVTAQLKGIIDRFQLLWARNVLAGEQSGLRVDRTRPALAFYVSAKDDPFATATKKTAALLPLKYASNTAGFTLDDESCRAIIGPHKPGDIDAEQFQAQVETTVALLVDKIQAL